MYIPQFHVLCKQPILADNNIEDKFQTICIEVCSIEIHTHTPGLHSKIIVLVSSRPGPRCFVTISAIVGSTMKCLINLHALARTMFSSTFPISKKSYRHIGRRCPCRDKTSKHQGAVFLFVFCTAFDEVFCIQVLPAQQQQKGFAE